MRLICATTGGCKEVVGMVKQIQPAARFGKLEPVIATSTAHRAGASVCPVVLYRAVSVPVWTVV